MQPKAITSEPDRSLSPVFIEIASPTKDLTIKKIVKEIDDEIDLRFARVNKLLKDIRDLEKTKQIFLEKRN